MSRSKSFLLMWMFSIILLASSEVRKAHTVPKETSLRIRDWGLNWTVIKSQDPQLLGKEYISSASSSTTAFPCLCCRALHAHSVGGSCFVVCSLGSSLLSLILKICRHGKMLFHPSAVLLVVYILSKSVLS